MKKLQRLTALMLAVIMAFTVLPLSSFATEVDRTLPVDAVEEIPALSSEDDPIPLTEPEPAEDVSPLPDFTDTAEVPELPIVDEIVEILEELPLETPAELLPVERPSVDAAEDFSSVLEPIVDELEDDLNVAVLLAASDFNINSAAVTLSTPGTYTISGTGTATTNNITIYGAFAQAESENISANVRWGQRQAMRQGRVRVRWSQLYGFEKDADGKGRIIPEQADVVRRIYHEFLAGASIRMIISSLVTDQIPNKAGEVIWHKATIRSILTNEKYCGDVLTQKTFVEDCMDGRTFRNRGQLPQYFIQDHHEAIVSRDIFNRAQAEMARRTAQVSPSSKIRTPGHYASKYALSERLFCGECGSRYRRCTWVQKGTKRVVWRCYSRMDYGKKYCHNSPSVDELPLQTAILKAINTAMSRKDVLIRDIAGAMELELAPTPGETLSLADIERRLEEIEPETMQIIARTASAGRTDEDTELLRALVNEAAALKEKRAYLKEQQKNNAQVHQRIQDATAILEDTPAEIVQWDEPLIRQLVETVKVLAADKILVELCGGVQIEQNMA